METNRLHTKIICTLGPAVNDEILDELIEAGMDVVRLNFSHGDQDIHHENIKRVQRARKNANKPIGIMLDTKGPEIRLEKIISNQVMLKKGQMFTLHTTPVEGDDKHASITYAGLTNDVQVGNRILIDDGLVGMVITDVTEETIVCKVENDGMIASNKGVNVPDVSLGMPYLSEKDRSDILFGVKAGVDFIAASFTRCAEDILEVRKVCSEVEEGNVSIIAKIENMQGVNNIDEILRVSEGIMVARGDLGVEIPLEKVPVIQKKLIHKAYTSGKRVITATQMLDSMMKNPRPTRAEATDIANAIYDGTSAIMLSGETAAGLYPVESLKTMVRIAKEAEADINYDKRFRHRDVEEHIDVTNAISHATCTTALDLKAAAIITVTKSGRTAMMISKFRPSCPIITCTTSERVCRQLNLSWGVIPLVIEEETYTDDLLKRAVEAGEQAGLVKQGEVVVMTAGVPMGISGTTNLLKVHVVGDVLVTGKGITNKRCHGVICVAKNIEEAIEEFQDGNILVVPQTDHRLITQIRKASGLIIEDPNPNGHGAIAGMSLNIPVIIGAENATQILKSGTPISLDAEHGVVYNDCRQ